MVNTAYNIERLQATLCSRLAPLVRRTTRAAARQKATLEAGMWLVVGTAYNNFCRAHRSVRLPGGGSGAAERRRWVERTPAQAAGLTDHRWSLYELLSFAAFPRLLHPRSGAGDDRDGCRRLLVRPDSSSTVEWGTTVLQVAPNNAPLLPEALHIYRYNLERRSTILE